MRKPAIAATLGALILMVVGIVTFVRVSAGDTPSRFVPAEPPRAVPSLRFVDGDGHTVGLGDFAGKVVLLNLWATWCGPCVREMPSLDRLQATMGGSDFVVIALSVDRGGLATVVPFFQRTGVRSLPIYLDPAGGAAQRLGVRGLPTTLLIDRDGHEVARAEGAVDWTGADATTAITRLLDHNGAAKLIRTASPR
ncbi:MAG: TlpA disulfide reductase family protein [Azospirillaceae bacterium]|nr:TlpA disulfide reductase family protein [Azospirillaceae bacterium]